MYRWVECNLAQQQYVCCPPPWLDASQSDAEDAAAADPAGTVAGVVGKMTMVLTPQPTSHRGFSRRDARALVLPLLLYRFLRAAT